MRGTVDIAEFLEVRDLLRDVTVERDVLKEAAVKAYGHLWHANENTNSPIPVRPIREAWIAARAVLNDALADPDKELARNSIAVELGVEAMRQIQETKDRDTN